MERAVRPVSSGRPRVWARRAGHEGGRRGDDRCRRAPRRHRRPGARPVVVACVVDEEHASIGAEALVESHRADAAIVTEPTDSRWHRAQGLRVGRGGDRGRAAHGSRPQEGRDAIVRMGHVLVGLEALDKGLRHGRLHPLLGAASVHASLIQGGRELSSYPDRCHLQIERRTVPGEPPGVAGNEVQAILDRLRNEDPEFRGAAKVTFGRPPQQYPRATNCLRCCSGPAWPDAANWYEFLASPPSRSTSPAPCSISARGSACWIATFTARASR